MRTRTIFLIFSAGVLALSSCRKENITDYTSFVDPFIGTGGHGHTFPGATYPYGMVQIVQTRVFLSGTPAQVIIPQIVQSMVFHIHI